MKGITRYIAGLSLSLALSITAFAEDKPSWEVEGEIGLHTDYLSSGESMTGNNPSLSAYVVGSYDWFFVELTMNTLQKNFFERFQAEWIPAIGVTGSLGEVDLYATYRLYRYTGGKLAIADKASELNYDELAVGVEWNGFYSELAWAARADSGGSRDMWLELGYEHEFANNLTLSGALGFTHHQDASKYRFTFARVELSYGFENGLAPYVGYSLGGQNADNESIENRFVAGIRYSF